MRSSNNTQIDATQQTLWTVFVLVIGNRAHLHYPNECGHVQHMPTTIHSYPQ